MQTEEKVWCAVSRAGGHQRAVSVCFVPAQPMTPPPKAKREADRQHFTLPVWGKKKKNSWCINSRAVTQLKPNHERLPQSQLTIHDECTSICLYDTHESTTLSVHRFGSVRFGSFRFSSLLFSSLPRGKTETKPTQKTPSSFAPPANVHFLGQQAGTGRAQPGIPFPLFLAEIGPRSWYMHGTN